MTGGAPVCGNGELEPPEEACDGDDFGALTCKALGFDDGELACAEGCRAVDSSGCTRECVPRCDGLECGLDPECGVSCGSCAEGTCVGGQCQTSGPECPADADCSYRSCGADPVCGTSCGTCSAGSTCIEGQCQTSGRECPADADCSYRSCGPDPVCGASCGACGASAACADGQCRATGPTCADGMLSYCDGNEVVYCEGGEEQARENCLDVLGDGEVSGLCGPVGDDFSMCVLPAGERCLFYAPDGSIFPFPCGSGGVVSQTMGCAETAAGEYHCVDGIPSCDALGHQPYCDQDLLAVTCLQREGQPFGQPLFWDCHSDFSGGGCSVDHCGQDDFGGACDDDVIRCDESMSCVDITEESWGSCS